MIKPLKQQFCSNKLATLDPSKGNLLSNSTGVNELTFYLYDHLGNNRLAFGISKNLIGYNYRINYAVHYFPYGKVMYSFSDGGSADRYPTTGHERDDETGLDYRGARFYDSETGRFLSLDPLAAKFPAWSAYNYVMGNPIILIDADGKAPKPPMHFEYLTTTALQIIDYAIANGATSKGAVFVLAHAIRESGWDGSTNNYNLFGRMAGAGEPSKGETEHGKVKDYTNLGKYDGALKDYFNDLNTKYSDALAMIKSGEINADKVNQGFRTAGYQLSKAERNRTGKSSCCGNCNGYGEQIVEIMGSVRKHLGASLNYGIKQIDEFIRATDFMINGNVLSQESKVEL